MTRKFSKKIIAVAVAGSLFAPFAATGAFGDDDGEERFAESQYRHDVMEHFNYSIKKILQNFQGNVQHPEHFAPIATIMASTATMTKAAFEKDTRGMEGHTKAKDEIWDNWEDFSSRLDQLEADTAAFAEVAQSGNMEQIGPAFRKAVSQCKACHDKYKAD